jgi:carbon storage regulator
MLVLSRKQGESIVIDGGIKLTVLEVRGSVVRLGIEAPKQVTVLRSELEERRRNQEPASLDWSQRLEWPRGLDCSSASTPGQLAP